MERVLARHAHRPVGLVGVPGRVGRGLIGEQLGRGDLEPRRSRFGGPHCRRQRHRDDHRLLRAVHEVRLHRLEGADRLAELSTRRGVLERDLFQALERARHRRGAGECAAPTERVAVDTGCRRRDRARRHAVEVHRVARLTGEVHRRRRCARRADRPAPPSGPSLGVEQRHDLVDGPRPRHAVRGAVERAVAQHEVVALRARHDGHRAVGDLEPRAREEPTAEHAGLRERQRYGMPPGDPQDLDGIRQRAARSAGGLGHRHPGQAGLGDRIPDGRRPAVGLGLLDRPRTSRCRRTPRVAVSDSNASTPVMLTPQPLGRDGAQDLDGAAADGEHRRGEDGVGEEALEQRRRVRHGLDVGEAPDALEQVLLEARAHLLHQRGLDRRLTVRIDRARHRQRQVAQPPEPCGRRSEQLDERGIELRRVVLAQVLLEHQVGREPPVGPAALEGELLADLGPSRCRRSRRRRRRARTRRSTRPR